MGGTKHSQPTTQGVTGVARLAPLCVVLLSSLGSVATGTAAEELLDGIAAQVGSHIVLVSEVNQVAGPVAEKMRRSGVSESEILHMRADVLDRLIESRLISIVVRRLELNASQVEVDQAIASIASETGLTMEQLEASVAGHGLTIDEYRAKIKAEIERSKVLNSMVRSRVRVEPSEIRALYAKRLGNQPVGGEELHLRHLLVASGAAIYRDRDTACRLAEDAAARIASGEITFEAVARQLSDANPERAGDLGWIHRRDLADWMEPVVNSLEVEQVSGVVETDFGCNLLQLVERRPFQPVSFEKAQRALENAIFRQKMEEEYVRWIDTLRKQTYIERKGVFRDLADSGTGEAQR